MPTTALGAARAAGPASESVVERGLAFLERHAAVGTLGDGAGAAMRALRAYGRETTAVRAALSGAIADHVALGNHAAAAAHCTRLQDHDAAIRTLIALRCALVAPCISGRGLHCRCSRPRAGGRRTTPSAVRTAGPSSVGLYFPAADYAVDFKD